MIALHLLEFYHAAPATIAHRSGNLIEIEHAGERYSCLTWCSCADAEIAVIPNDRPLNTNRDVDVLVVCPRHELRTFHGRRFKNAAEREAEYAQVAAVRKQLNVDFSVKHRAGVIAWGDPRWSQKPPEVKS